MDKYLVTLEVAIEVEAESFFHAKEEALKKINIRDGIRAIAVETEMLNPAGEYAIKFAKNHCISIAEAMEHPMVKARFNVFNETGE